MCLCKFQEKIGEWVRVAHDDLAPGRKLKQGKSLSDTKV